MLNIPKMHVLPGLEKNSNEDYTYDEKYIGKVYQYEDELIFFQDKKILKFPINVVEAIFDGLGFALESDVAELKLTTVDMASEVEELVNHNAEKFENLSNVMDNVSTTMIELSGRVSKVEGNTESLQSIEGISAAMDDKLQMVHKNFQTVAENIIAEKIEDYISTLQKSANKLKPGTVLLYKEMGLKIDEIMAMAKEGLI